MRELSAHEVNAISGANLVAFACGYAFDDSDKNTFASLTMATTLGFLYAFAPNFIAANVGAKSFSALYAALSITLAEKATMGLVINAGVGAVIGVTASKLT